MPRRRKLHILRFAFRGKSSVVPLLLLSPPNPLRWALAGAPVGDPLESPGGNVLEDTGRALVVPPRNGAFDAIKSAAACTSALLPQPLRAAHCRECVSTAEEISFGVGLLRKK